MITKMKYVYENIMKYVYDSANEVRICYKNEINHIGEKM